MIRVMVLENTISKGVELVPGGVDDDM